MATGDVDENSSKGVLSALAGFFVVLALARLVVLRGEHHLLLAVVAAVSAMLMGAAALLAGRRRRRPPAAIGLLGLVPVLNCLVPLVVTGDVHETSMLLLALVALSTAMTSTWFLAAVGGTAGATWVVVVLLHPALRGAPEVRFYAFQLVLAAVVAGLLRITILRRQRRLRAVRDELAAVAQRFVGVFQGSPAGIGLADESGRLVTVNPALCRLLGRPEEELLGADVLRHTHPDDTTDHEQLAARIEAAADGVARMEARFVRPDGDVRWVWMTMSRTAATGDGAADQRRTLVQMQDVTDRFQAERAVRDSERLLTAVAAVARRIRTGEDARTSVIAAARELAGSDGTSLIEPAASVEGETADELVVTAASTASLVGTRIPMSATSMTAQVYRTGQPVFLADPATHPTVSPALLALSGARSMLWQPVVADGHVIAVLAVGWSRRMDDVGDRRTRAVALLADETALALEHEQLLRHLERMAYTDTLTGLANRRAWQAQLPRLLAQARRTGRPLTVAIADLDHFKHYNDTRGHPAGDDLLHRAAAAFTDALRDSDLIARWGGEEFAMALPDCSAEHALPVLDRVRAATPDGETCSIGYATWDARETVEQLLARADDALYRAKEEGRDRVRPAPAPAVAA